MTIITDVLKPINEMTVAELRIFLATPRIAEFAEPFNTKTTKSALIENAKQAHHAAGMAEATAPKAPATSVETRDSDATPVAKPVGEALYGLHNAPRDIIKTLRAHGSRVYGLRGRGMGAKHYVTPKQAKPRGTDADKPLSYGDRVRHYAKQNGQATLTADNFPGALLTPAQWRRAQHKQNKNRAFGTKASRYV